MRTSVVWFRRDLRLADQPALVHALEASDRVAPLFVADGRLLHGRRQAPNRTWFMAASVAALAADLAGCGAPLTILRGDPVDLVPRFARRVGAQRIVVSRDHAPYGRARDARVEAAAAPLGIAFERLPGVLVHEPDQIRSAAGAPYTVFSPFRRTWDELERRPVVGAPLTFPGIDPRRPRRVDADLASLDPAAAFGRPEPTADRALLPEPGERAARARLAAWASSPALERYATDRDRLDLPGTSRLSQDLRWGLLSPVEVLERCDGPGEGRRRYRSEIAWRDFYAHLLAAMPRVAREPFRRDLEGVAWESSPAVVDAWREGRTGYPIVDAAMRQLRATGWMHNRGRMIVASFLTKHLGVDWRVGEEHFMEHLVDGDIASNNGGWQWAASTGTDPQPWFRIFNPLLQARRHDPDGTYVRRWVPELAGLDAGEIHAPMSHDGYPAPIVDHLEARARALAAYGRRATTGSRAQET